MSIIHKIVCKKTFDISTLDKRVSSIEGAKYEDRGEGVFYFWIDEKSTKGFDITLEKDFIEIRNTILSNKFDYDLTNIIVSEIVELTKGIILDENDEKIFSLPVFDNKRIAEIEIQDCKTIKALSKEHENITICGPIREVYFGKKLYEFFKEFENEKLKDTIFNLILMVNYLIPNYENGNVIEVGNSEDDVKIMKLLTNETDYLIGKYDYILLNTLDGQSIMITNGILNTMLPSNWKLVDEFTIIAPITTNSEWNKLLKNAKKFDLSSEFRNN